MSPHVTAPVSARRGGAVRVAELVVVLLAVRALGLPEPRMPALTVDPSYQVALNRAFLDGLQFGRDIVFTFGPLGFLHVPMFDPALQGLQVVFGVLLGTVVGANLVVLSRQAGRTAWLVLAPAPLALLLMIHDPDGRLFVACGLIGLVALSGRRVAPAWLLLGDVALLAVIALIKFTFFLLASGIVIVMAAADLARGRRAGAVVPVAYAAMVCALWVAAGQEVAAFPEFVRGGLEIARTYSEAMAVPGPALEPLLFLTAAASLAAAVLRTERPDGVWRGVPHVVVLGAVLFLLFKSGFTRHLYHRETAVTGIAALALVYASASWGRGDRIVRVLCGAALVAATLGLGVSPHASIYAAKLTPAGLGHAFGGNAWRVEEVVRGWEDSRRRWTATRTRLAREHPLPVVATGTVDVLSDGQAMLLAHDGVTWRPRPTFQPYQATSTALQERNAEGLRRRGADVLLADLDTIDGRWPMLDLGRSLPELLRWYDVTPLATEFLVLTRRAAPRTVTLAPLGSVTVPLGGSVRLPDVSRGRPLWATVEVEPTWLGRLAAVVFRVPEVALEVTLVGGETRRHRLVPAMARSGFLLSPLVEHPNALGELFSWDRTRLLGSFVVTAMRIVPAAPGARFFAPSVRVELARLEFATQEVAPPSTDEGTEVPLRLIHVYHARVASEGARLRIDASGGDPFVSFLLAPPSTVTAARELVLDVIMPHADMFQVFTGRRPFVEDRSMRFQLGPGVHRVRVPLPLADGWILARVDPGTRPGVYDVGVRMAATLSERHGPR